MTATFIDAIIALDENAQVSVDESTGEITWHDGNPNNLTTDQINAKRTELTNAEPMRRLREARDTKLAETDWWCCSDRTPTQAQLDYRTALRNLPETESPSLNDAGQLTRVAWPIKPE